MRFEHENEHEQKYELAHEYEGDDEASPLFAFARCEIHFTWHASSRAGGALQGVEMSFFYSLMPRLFWGADRGSIWGDRG